MEPARHADELTDPILNMASLRYSASIYAKGRLCNRSSRRCTETSRGCPVPVDRGRGRDPGERSVEMARRLQEAGSPCELVVEEDMWHVFVALRNSRGKRGVGVASARTSSADEVRRSWRKRMSAGRFPPGLNSTTRPRSTRPPARTAGADVPAVRDACGAGRPGGARARAPDGARRLPTFGYRLRRGLFWLLSRADGRPAGAPAGRRKPARSDGSARKTAGSCTAYATTAAGSRFEFFHR